MDKLSSDYLAFKKSVVEKFYNSFPLYLLTKDIFEYAKLSGFDLTNKKEQAVTALNNLFFKSKKGVVFGKK